MNCNDIESRLADYLGAEMSSADRERFEQHLQSCGCCRAEVGGLASVADGLRNLPSVSMEHAARRTRDLEVRRRRAKPGRMLLAGLRYAAILLLGAGIGWRIKPPADELADPGGHTSPPVVRTVAAEPLHPAWVEAARRVNRRYANRSSFVRSLAALSGAKDKL